MSTDETQEAVRGDDPASGMTIRESFAMAAMQGMIANPEVHNCDDMTPNAYAHDAILYADALLAVLEADV